MTGPLREDEPDDYVVSRLREALAEDDRTTEQNLEIAVAGRRVVITGEVSTDHRREMVGVVASEFLPGRIVCNETVVARITDPGEVETLS